MVFKKKRTLLDLIIAFIKWLGLVFVMGVIELFIGIFVILWGM